MIPNYRLNKSNREKINIKTYDVSLIYILQMIVPIKLWNIDNIEL